MQVVANRVVEDLSWRGIVLIGQVAGDRIAVNAGRRSVVLYLEIVAHGVARARRLRRVGRSDQNRRPVVLDLQVAVHAGSTNLVLRRAGGKVLNLHVAAYRCSWTDRERAPTVDLQVAANARVNHRQSAAILRHIASHDCIDYAKVLARRHSYVTVEGRAEDAGAVREGYSKRDFPHRNRGHHGVAGRGDHRDRIAALRRHVDAGPIRRNGYVHRGNDEEGETRHQGGGHHGVAGRSDHRDGTVKKSWLRRHRPHSG